MAQFLTFFIAILRIVSFPLYLSWFYFLYYMFFQDFKVGGSLFLGNIVLGYILLAINKNLSALLQRTVLLDACDSESEKSEMRKMFKEHRM